MYLGYLDRAAAGSSFRVFLDSNLLFIRERLLIIGIRSTTLRNAD